MKKEHPNYSGEITLGGRKLFLLFNFTALRRVKKITGLEFMSEAGIKGLPSVDYLPVMVMAAAGHSGNGDDSENWPTEQWIADNLLPQHIGPLMKMISGLADKAKELGNAPPEESPKHLNGSTSGPSQDSTLVAVLRSSGN